MSVRAQFMRRRGMGLETLRGICRHSQTGLSFFRYDIPGRYNGSQILIRWGTTGQAPPHAGPCLNTPDAIRVVSDKSGFRGLMMEPDPILCPPTFFSWEDYLDSCRGDFIPAVVRPRYHAKGRDFNVIRSPDDDFVSLPEGGYISPVIQKSREFRVFILHGRALWVAEKFPADPTEVAWNMTPRTHFDNVRWGEWPLGAVRRACEAFDMSGLDFGGVDVIVDTEGRPYVLEINSAPMFTSEYRQRCTATGFDWVVRNESFSAIPRIEELGGYRKFIHPAVCSEAIMVSN